MRKLFGKIIGILTDQGFDEKLLNTCIEALRSEGAEIIIISSGKKIKGWNGNDWGKEYSADVLISKADVADYSALFLPEGEMNIDKLRRNEKATSFVKKFMDSGKPVAAFGFGSVMLLEANKVKEKKMVSIPALEKDFVKAGAKCLDQPIVVDGNLITASEEAMVNEFTKVMIEEFDKFEEYPIKQTDKR